MNEIKRININFNIFFNLTKLELIKICKLHKFKIKYIYKITKLELIFKIHYYLFNNNILHKIKLFHNIKNNKLNNKSNNKLNNKSNTKINNETFGITCEYGLCTIYNIPHLINKKRINKNYLNNLENILFKIKYDFKHIYNITKIKHIGHLNDKSDFICNSNKTLSVKSNISKNLMVCPQYIGQSSYKSFVKKINTIQKKFNINFKYNKLINPLKIKSSLIKQFIYYNFNKLIYFYIKYLFCCDYLLWIYIIHSKNSNLNEIKYKIFDNLNSKIITNLKPFNKSKFKFTKSINNWNYSNTIKYNNISLGVFQISESRKHISFRFYFKNILRILEIN